jgi:hypothetical protein
MTTCCRLSATVFQYIRSYPSYLEALSSIRNLRMLQAVETRDPFDMMYIRGRVSKHITSGSKAAVMNVIVFLYVPLGSSEVQLQDTLGSRCACSCSEGAISSQIGDRTWGVYSYYWRVAFWCAFLWAKGLNAKDIHNEMFPVYGGKCLSRKAVHNWVPNVLLMTKWLKRRCRSGRYNSRKTSMLRVSTHW